MRAEVVARPAVTQSDLDDTGPVVPADEGGWPGTPPYAARLGSGATPPLDRVPTLIETLRTHGGATSGRSTRLIRTASTSLRAVNAVRPARSDVPMPSDQPRNGRCRPPAKPHRAPPPPRRPQHRPPRSPLRSRRGRGPRPRAPRGRGRPAGTDEGFRQPIRLPDPAASTRPRTGGSELSGIRQSLHDVSGCWRGRWCRAA